MSWACQLQNNEELRVFVSAVLVGQLEVQYVKTLEKEVHLYDYRKKPLALYQAFHYHPGKSCRALGPTLFQIIWSGTNSVFGAPAYSEHPYSTMGRMTDL